MPARGGKRNGGFRVRTGRKQTFACASLGAGLAPILVVLERRSEPRKRTVVQLSSSRPKCTPGGRRVQGYFVLAESNDRADRELVGRPTERTQAAARSQDLGVYPDASRCACRACSFPTGKGAGMKLRFILAIGMLSTSVPAVAQPGTSMVEPQAVAGLDRMGAALRNLRNFSIQADVTREEVLTTGRSLCGGRRR